MREHILISMLWERNRLNEKIRSTAQCHQYSEMLLPSMEVTSANFSLPAMCHVVCTIVAAGITSVDVSTSEPPTTQISPHNQPSAPLPQGYVAYPDIGFAYKFHDDQVSWIEAMKRCMKDGSQLALIDTVKKIKYVRSQTQSMNRVHVGIIRVDGGRTWIGIATGSPVASSLPWHNDHGDGADRNCVNIEISSDDGLCTYSCSTTRSSYVCEIPILNANTMATN